MKDPELQRRLAFVPPERRALIEARIYVLERYRAIPRPTTRDAEIAAAELGLVVRSFYNLLRAWRADRDPSKIDVANHSRDGPGRRFHPGDEFVLGTLRRLAPDNPIERNVRTVQTAAAAAGIDVRALNGLRQMAREHRSAAGAGVPAAGVFVDAVCVNVPVAVDGDMLIRPVATVLADRSKRRIVAAVVCPDPSGPEAVTLLLRKALEGATLRLKPATSARASIPIEIDTTADPGWPSLIAGLLRAGVVHHGQAFRRGWGGRLGGDMLFPQMLGLKTFTMHAMSSSKRRRMELHGPRDNALTIEQAQQALDERIAATGGGHVTITGDAAALAHVLSTC